MQLPTPQQHTAQGTERQQRRTRATAGGASAAILAAAGASTLLPAAAAQAQDGAFTPSPAVAGAEAAQTAPVAEMAAEPVLLSSLAAQAAPTMAPGGIAPLAAPGVVPGVIPGAMPAVSLLEETSELAQTVTATAPVAAEESYESFWPEGHWSDSGSGGWAGIIGTSLSLTGTVAGVGGAYLLWRSLNQAPTFEYPIVNETFTEQPCGEAVYTAPGKDANNQDEDLTYSIVASEFDDSDLVEIDNDGKVTFKQDPLYDSPGDRDRDGVYSFTVQVEDPRGETAEQAVFLTIEGKAALDFVAIDDTLDFIQHGGSVCADHFEIDASSMSPSLFDISGGSGNDLADIDALDVTDIGIRLGAGADTLFVDAAATGVQDVLVDLGEGRDTIELDVHVQTMVVQNFDADDLLILDGGRLTDGGGLGVAFYAAAPVVFTSELLALGALTATTYNEVVAYQNGQDSYLLVENGAGTISTTVKFEDTILTDYSQIIV